MNTEAPPPQTTTLTTTPSPTNQKPQPKRFIRSQIPTTLLNNPSLNKSISLLPSNYNFEVHKCIHRIHSLSSPRIALQLPEGLLLFAPTLADIFTTFANASSILILSDVTYGACCIDDLSASALEADLLIHYGHSCLVPVDETVVPCVYVFVEISINVMKLVETVKVNEFKLGSRNLVVAGTIQFAGAIRAVKGELEKVGFKVFVPQVKPLSAGEVLGCTAPRVGGRGEGEEELVVLFVADGRFHLEAMMIANPGVRRFYRYDPYLGRLFLEEYDHVGMKGARRKAIEKAREAKSWGVVLGTLGRQGNPKVLERLEGKMREKGIDSVVVLMSEISPARILLFEDSVDAWVQIACPRLSIDWGEAFERPLLNTFEAEIALGLIPGWWEKEEGKGVGCGRGGGSCGGCSDGGEKSGVTDGGDYPMDYYSQDGGEWNSCHMKKQNRPLRRNLRSTAGNGTVS